MVPKSIRNPNILVTGGAGFLGQAIVEEFLSQDSPVLPNKIVVFDLIAYKGIADDKIKMIIGDILDVEALNMACADIDVVIHAAAIVDWGTRSEQEVYDINVKGTENIITACKKHAIENLIYTSSLDAVYGGHALVDINESHPYPSKHPNMYCKSKYLSEKLVLAANTRGFRTCVLRPSDIYGEGDPYHIDSLVNMAKGGFYVRLGNGKSRCQHVYVRNMAHAHILVTKAVMEGNKVVEGNAYFITDQSGNFFKFFDQVVIGAGYKIWPKNFWIPRGIAYGMALISEGIAMLWRPIKKYNPKFSRFAVIYTCTDFTFTSEKARKDFGYEPKYDEQEALERTVDYYRIQKRNCA